MKLKLESNDEFVLQILRYMDSFFSLSSGKLSNKDIEQFEKCQAFLLDMKGSE